MEKVQVSFSGVYNNTRGYSADLIFIDGREGKHREFKKESCPDERLKISGFVTSEEVMVEVGRLVKLLKLDVVNKDHYIPEVKCRLE